MGWWTISRPCSALFCRICKKKRLPTARNTSPMQTAGRNLRNSWMRKADLSPPIGTEPLKPKRQLRKRQKQPSGAFPWRIQKRRENVFSPAVPLPNGCFLPGPINSKTHIILIVPVWPGQFIFGSGVFLHKSGKGRNPRSMYLCSTIYTQIQTGITFISFHLLRTWENKLRLLQI